MNFNEKGHELFISKIQDQIRSCQKRYQMIQTSFLTPVQQEIVQKLAGKKIMYSLYGGYENAQRKVACFSSYETDFEYGITILVSKVDLRFRKVSHKDVLGALMNLGIEREMLGDLIVEEDCIIIFIKEKMAEYIIQNTNRIANCPVSFEILDNITITSKLTEEILVNASSLRLDAIISSLAHVSRSEATMMLRRGFVKLNDVVLEENRQLCNNDFVSIRRCGRFQFKEVKTVTKKGCLLLRFDKFI